MTTARKTKLNTFAVSEHFLSRADATVIALRKAGYTAYSESDEQGKQYYIVTDASRAIVLLTGGHGQMLIAT